MTGSGRRGSAAYTAISLKSVLGEITAYEIAARPALPRLSEASLPPLPRRRALAPATLAKPRRVWYPRTRSARSIYYVSACSRGSEALA
jgi:hypothetical protein